MKKTLHGILSDDGILTGFGWKSSKFQIAQISTISDICAIMKTLGLRQIWILSGTKIFNRLALQHKKTFADGQSFGFAPKEIKNVTTVWGNGLQKSVIVFAGVLEAGNENNLARQALMNQWSLFEIKNAERLFNAVQWLYEKTGVLPTVPIRTGKTIARISANLSDDDFLPLNENTDIYHDNRARDLILLDSAKGKSKKYIHGFDKNSAYLASARSYSFGLGDSVKYTGEFRKDYHGLWKVEIDFNSINKNYQKLFDNLSENEWLWTSDIEVLLEFGAKIKIVEGNIWKCNKRIFEKFCKILKTALDEAKVLELKTEESAIKAIYTRFFGWLNRQPENDREEIFYRPDWYSAIISLTKANLIRNIRTLLENSDAEIVAVNRDEIIFASDLQAVEMPFPLQDGENRKATFKHSFSFEQSEISEIIANASSGSDLARKLKELKKSQTLDKTRNLLERTKISKVRKANG